MQPVGQIASMMFYHQLSSSLLIHPTFFLICNTPEWFWSICYCHPISPVCHWHQRTPCAYFRDSRCFEKQYLTTWDENRFDQTVLLMGQHNAMSNSEKFLLFHILSPHCLLTFVFSVLWMRPQDLNPYRLQMEVGEDVVISLQINPTCTILRITYLIKNAYDTLMVVFLNIPQLKKYLQRTSWHL